MERRIKKKKWSGRDIFCPGSISASFICFLLVRVAGPLDSIIPNYICLHMISKSLLRPRPGITTFESGQSIQEMPSVHPMALASQTMLVINDQFPGPLIECNEGDTLNIVVQNDLDVDVSIHWHGIWQTGTPWVSFQLSDHQMDGVTGEIIIHSLFDLRSASLNVPCRLRAPSPTGLMFGISLELFAHARNLAIDGIAGPLIIHSPRDPLVRGKTYDNDVILFISFVSLGDISSRTSSSIVAQHIPANKTYSTSTVILDGTLSAAGYFGTQAAPSANSALINGVGIFNCSFAAPGSRCQTPTRPLEITLPPNQKTRFRLIQAGSHAMFWCALNLYFVSLRKKNNKAKHLAHSHFFIRFSADQHLLTVVEADSIAVVGPNNLHRLQFHNGQSDSILYAGRYSVIVDTKSDKVGSSFYLRAAMDTDCCKPFFSYRPHLNILLSSKSDPCVRTVAPGIPGPDATALAIVRVASKPTQINSRPPATRDWRDTVGGKCTDLNSNTLSPLIRENACTNVLDTMYFNTSLGAIIRRNPQNKTKVETLSRFFVNNATWTTFRYRPLLQDLAMGGKGYLNSTEVTALTLNTGGCYDIVINNLDAGIDHPLHLHLVAQGPGNIGPQNKFRASIKLDNPLRRDVSDLCCGRRKLSDCTNKKYIQPTVRVEANNPGVWILHCHIGWHLAAGFAGVVVMQPSAVSKFQIPPANQALCSGRTSSNINTTEPGRLVAAF
ncbi:uncharacterized protein VP01_990g3 [Puccinia sorghi]|uniref:Uncharacterized protein n=1 Tax=Puccinia sorghi TaxID=27349 RepID=A0A0L6U7F8_9BASI|nr:uncharacterized protein VP01_990g3 [Puccinia sorghi]